MMVPWPRRANLFQLLLGCVTVGLVFRIKDVFDHYRRYLDQDVALSKDVVQKYSDVALCRINSGLIELRRLFLVEDLVDSLKFAVFLWILTYVGALFNGLTLLLLGLVGAFSLPVIYERHQTEIDQYTSVVKNQLKDIMAKVQAKVPGSKKLE